jgi:hypothetical protein
MVGWLALAHQGCSISGQEIGECVARADVAVNMSFCGEHVTEVVCLPILRVIIDWFM